jgi:hypothetical protein
LAPEYGARAIPEYREGEWSDAAFVEQRGDLLTRIEVYIAEHAGPAGDILAIGTRMPCTWKNPEQHRKTDWYRFQEGIKAHLDECWDILQQRLPDIASR